jgi:hypothetical protein
MVMKRTSLVSCGLALVNWSGPGSLQAQIWTNPDVKIAFIADYRFGQSSSERATKGRLATRNTSVRSHIEGTVSSSNACQLI